MSERPPAPTGRPTGPRRGTATVLALGVVAALAFMPAVPDHRSGPGTPAATSTPGADATDPTVTVLGDGSTSDTGPQPGQPAPVRLKLGEQPPQFVVFSFDAPTEDGNHLFSGARTSARSSGADVTFFLRGVDVLPASVRWQYQPPQHEVGTAAVPFPTDAQVRATLQQLGRAWLDGDEIADGFIGQFCGPEGGRDWSTTDWQSEIGQGYSMVNFWKTGTGFTDLPPLPFDYQTELAGGRAPCLEGRPNLLPAEKDAGWRYDASSPGDTQRWPARIDGIWEFPLQRIPSGAGEVLSANQPPQTYLNAFDRVYHGSRAPLVIDTDLAPGHGTGPDLQAAETAMKDLCHRDGVRCVSFRQLADWLDAQDPGVLDHLRALGSTSTPNWAAVVGP
ncbi:hypothetical protein ACGF12_25280 [Kitasatospora sp. NPDC048296]|uniref:hypothetical protein n=1 Tax=Kitasatospora sp. NPDC048296 TaxID=3364048 RepID=UPI00371BFBA0